MKFNDWVNLGTISGRFMSASEEVKAGSFNKCMSIINNLSRHCEEISLEPILDCIISHNYNWVQTMNLLDAVYSNGYDKDLIDLMVNTIKLYDRIKPDWVIKTEKWNDFVLEELCWKIKYRGWFNLEQYVRICRADWFFYNAIPNCDYNYYIGGKTLDEFVNEIGKLFRSFTKFDRDYMKDQTNRKNRYTPFFDTHIKNIYDNTNSFSMINDLTDILDSYTLRGIGQRIGYMENLSWLDTSLAMPVLKDIKLVTAVEELNLDTESLDKLVAAVRFEYADMLVLGEHGKIVDKYIESGKYVEPRAMWKMAVDTVNKDNNSIVLIPGFYYIYMPDITKCGDYFRKDWLGAS